MKQDALAMSLLYDYYGDLLTEKQRACFDLYYNQDLSLSEIAEETGVTRQGVRDTLVRAAALLGNMEEKTGCIARAQRAQDLLGLGRVGQLFRPRVLDAEEGLAFLHRAQQRDRQGIRRIALFGQRAVFDQVGAVIPRHAGIIGVCGV